MRPAFLPPFNPLQEFSVEATHTPFSLTLTPPDSLPHFFTSQQFVLAIITSPFHNRLLSLIGNSEEIFKLPRPGQASAISTHHSAGAAGVGLVAES